MKKITLLNLILLLASYAAFAENSPTSNPDPIADAEFAILMGDFRLKSHVFGYTGEQRDFYGIVCSVSDSKVDYILGQRHRNDPLSSPDFSKNELSLEGEEYSVIYNRTIVSNELFPLKDLCIITMFHSPHS